MNRKFETVLSELLVLRAQEGEEAAFRRLVDTWSPQLLRFCRRRSDSSDMAREIVQVVWLQVVKGLRRLDDPTRFPAWLFTIAARACANQVRSQVQTRTLAAHYRDLAVSSEPSGEEALDLTGAIRALPSDQKHLLVLYYQYGYSVEEIGEQLEIPSGTVKSRLHKLREELRRLHEGDTDEEH